MALIHRIAKVALDHPELRPALMPLIREAAKIDHGWDEPLAGGTDVMRRLQNQLRKEQGLPTRPSSPEIPREANGDDDARP